MRTHDREADLPSSRSQLFTAEAALGDSTSSAATPSWKFTTMLSSLAPHESLHALARARLATIHGAPTPFDKPQIPSAWSASVGRAQPFFPPGAPATWSLAKLDSDVQLKR